MPSSHRYLGTCGKRLGNSYAQLTTSHLEDSIGVFRYYKKLAERDGTGERRSRGDRDEEANSIKVIVKHMAGNMRSRWTDFSDYRRHWS